MIRASLQAMISSISESNKQTFGLIMKTLFIQINFKVTVDPFFGSVQTLCFNVMQEFECFLGHQIKLYTDNKIQRKLHSSIHFLYPLHPSFRSRWGWSLSQRSSGERQGTPWTGRQSITGPHRDKRDKQPCMLTEDNFRDTN